METRPFDPAEYLDSPEAIADYLNGALNDGSSAEIADALMVAVRARGITDMAAETGLPRQTLYEALSGEGNPSFDTVMKVAKALDLKLTLQAA